MERKCSRNSFVPWLRTCRLQIVLVCACVCVGILIFIGGKRRQKPIKYVKKKPHEWHISINIIDKHDNQLKVQIYCAITYSLCSNKPRNIHEMPFVPCPRRVLRS